MGRRVHLKGAHEWGGDDEKVQRFPEIEHLTPNTPRPTRARGGDVTQKKRKKKKSAEMGSPRENGDASRLKS